MLNGIDNVGSIPGMGTCVKDFSVLGRGTNCIHPQVIGVMHLQLRCWAIVNHTSRPSRELLHRTLGLGGGSSLSGFQYDGAGAVQNISSTAFPPLHCIVILMNRA